MTRGSQPGERRGGRQKGTPNGKTVQRRGIAARAAAEGTAPLEVMLITMRALWKQAVDPKTGDVVNIGKAMQAVVVAKDAAPFIHPKLSNIQATGKDGEPLNPSEVTVVTIYDDGRNPTTEGS